jgi:hypothetical protein
METGAKKLKLSREIITLDPLHKVCGDLHEMMLQHFKKSDVLKVSEVSPEWNEAISTSAKCMAKIPLEIKRWDKQVPDVINESQRHYNNLQIECGVKEPAQISRQKIQLVAKFAPFLKKLNILNWSETVFDPQTLEFPKLETLGIESDDPIVFANETKLKKLSLSFENFNRATINWIEKQENLKEIELNLVNRNFFTFNPKAPKGIKQVKFWLDYKETRTTKLNNFMKPICDTLMVLEISGKIFLKNLELMVNEMPKLKTLKLDNSDFKNLNKANLISNSSITELKIDMKIPKMYYLLFSLVNLEDLSINRSIKIDDFEWIAENLLKLKKLSSYYFKPSQEIFEDRYDEMKENAEGINVDIEFN